MFLNEGWLGKSLLLIMVFILSAGAASAVTPQLVSTSTEPLLPGHYSVLGEDVSYDGKLALFSGVDGNFLRDLRNQTTTEIDLPGSSFRSMSGNGKYIVFSTSAVLSPSDTNGYKDIYRYDIEKMTYELVSTGRENLNYHDTMWVDTDFEGRYVAFVAHVRNIYNDQRLYVRDMQTGQVTLEGVSEFGTIANNVDAESMGLDMSSDGRYIAFGVDYWEDLGHGPAQYFVRDRVEGTIDSLYELRFNTTINFSKYQQITISGNGRYLFGGALIDGFPLQSVFHAVAFDLVTREFDIVSTSAEDVLGNDHSGLTYAHGQAGVRSSHDGNMVVFTSKATNLLDGVTGYTIFRKNRNTGEVTHVISSGGNVPNWTISGDGNTVFINTSTRLLPEEHPYHYYDAFAFSYVVDQDEDGYASDEDCNDDDFNVNPGVTEIPYNGYDENCNGMDDDDDLDDDDYGIAVDCDDNDADINPGQPEIPYNNDDENCSGMDDDDDVDTDGYGIAEDCNDNDSSIYPGATEIKHDGTDQDCNGYDLTIDILSAVYNEKDSLLTVKATSAWGETANLEVIGYWPMNWKDTQMNWKYDFEGANNPGTVSVVGFEGSETADVTIELK